MYTAQGSLICGANQQRHDQKQQHYFKETFATVNMNPNEDTIQNGILSEPVILNAIEKRCNISVTKDNGFNISECKSSS